MSESKLQEQLIDHVTEKLSNARLLLSDLFPYYAPGLYSMIPVLTRHEDLPTMAVDGYWRLYYNPEFVDRCESHEVCAVLLHELLHLLRNHHVRIHNNGFEQLLGNFAADCEINDDVESHANWCKKKGRKLSLPQGAIMPSCFGLKDGLFMEEYYAFLEKIRASVMQLIKEGKISLDISTRNERGGKNTWEIAKDGGNNDKDGENNQKPRAIGPEEAELVRTRVAKKMQVHASKNPGSLPGGLNRWADEILNPKISWQKELSSSIRGTVTRLSASGSDITYKRMSRRQVVLGDIIFPSQIEKLPTIAIVIDTSGSMRNEQLKQCISEVSGILQALGCQTTVQVLVVDAAVHSVKSIYKPKQIELLGGGGTDMGIGIAKALELKPKPDYIIVLTDGHTPWPIDAPEGVKVLVCLVGNGSGPSWAKTIKVE